MTRSKVAAGNTTGVPGAKQPSSFNAGFLYAGIWVVFLTVPVIGIIYGGADLPWQLVGYVSVGVFGGTYLWMAWRSFSWEDQGKTTSIRQLLIFQLLLAGIAACAVPAAGPWVSAFTPYMAALVIYTQPARIGMPAGILIWLVPSLIAFLLDWPGSPWTILGPGIAMVFIIVIWLTEYQAERDRQRAEELRQAEERDHIARDVHDVLGHSLTVLTVKAQLARRLAETDPVRARTEMAEMEELSREALTQVRSTVTRLKAPQLPGELDVAASTLESAQITPVIDSALEDGGAGVLAWSLREAITNVVRHSGATQCHITITPELLRVADNGLGLGESREGNGLRGVRERVQQSGATVMIGRAYPDMPGTTAQQPGTLLEVRLEALGGNR